jgi:hypothetical protein
MSKSNEVSTSRPIDTLAKKQGQPSEAHNAGVLAGAEWRLMREFRKFANTISETERADFFDGRNSDMWMRAFAEQLSKPKEFASND